ncbi:endonuclease domain-containing protein [Aliterella atlantica]|uniref:Endonuclease n=1 Tax=Aliterella atlantica CENA595 TaxID=1618023 RepID=A0A0D8ZZ67_9CYAN|nr:endonuclease domain-containing protein [Aliterella atlantica]KJH72516.1 endonuclease [Aliterella atlantica CENA595]
MSTSHPRKFVTSKYCLPYNPISVERAKSFRKNPTAAEKKMWLYLRTFKPRVLRQRPIDRFIVDFYCASLKLAIEVDGAYHFTEEAQAYDLERTRILEGYGLRVVRFTNDEVLHDFDSVCLQLEGMIPLNPPFKGDFEM